MKEKHTFVIWGKSLSGGMYLFAAESEEEESGSDCNFNAE